ncbi:hypothetical protein GCM10022214_11390 [Actinomadura miaoliensis]|uniref:Transposase n=1 Tax=Actinomadura miaoliensis TaxID=430685 RepID=A0ABP7V7K4_9ACTN
MLLCELRRKHPSLTAAAMAHELGRRGGAGSATDERVSALVRHGLWCLMACVTDCAQDVARHRTRRGVWAVWPGRPVGWGDVLRGGGDVLWTRWGLWLSCLGAVWAVGTSRGTGGDVLCWGRW